MIYEFLIVGCCVFLLNSQLYLLLTNDNHSAVVYVPNFLKGAHSTFRCLLVKNRK